MKSVLLLGLCFFGSAACTGKRELVLLSRGGVEHGDIEVSAEDLAMEQEALPDIVPELDTSIKPQAEHLSSSGRIDLMRLWELLTAGMNPDEKKIYAKEFVTVVQRYQEREAVQEHKDILMLILKGVVALAVVGVVAYVVYAVIAASKQETERVKCRSEAEKAASKAGASHAIFEKEVAAVKAQMAAARVEMQIKMERDAERVVHDFDRHKDEVVSGMRAAFTETQNMLAGIREQVRQAEAAREQREAFKAAFAKAGIGKMFFR